MAMQRYKVIMEVIDTKYYEKTFDFDSDDFYEPNEIVPQNMYDEIPELLEEIIYEDFQDDSSSWDWNKPEIGNRDGVFIEQVELI